jgi:thioesterase domain-containing protein
MTFTLELERALGLELAVTLVNEAPKFGQLCEMLRNYRAPRHLLLIPLKAGEGWPPVFFIHGVGGNVVEILPTARRMTYPGAVIGIRARGLARGEVPHSSVEAMAADYLREIKARQPQGPYYLCGYSFGGLVAFEIARRLSESGNPVGLVGLFDTMRSPLRWPLQAWLSILGRRVARGVARLRATALPTRLAELRPVSRDRRAQLTAAPTLMQRDGLSLPGSLSSAPSRVLRVAASALIASARYRPGFYRGQLTLFTPVGREPGLPPLESIWRKHARNLSIVETAGDHSTMLSAPNADSTAASLASCLSLKP